MRKFLIFTCFMVLFYPNEAYSQTQPIKAKQRVTPQLPKNHNAVAERMVMDSIIPIAQSNQYKQRIKALENKLKSAFLRNKSKELQFYSDTSMCLQCWYREETQFKNTPEELEKYIRLLERTHDLFEQPQLTPIHRSNLMEKWKSIERYRDDLIKAVDRNGRPIVGCSVTFYSGLFANIKVAVSSTKIRDIKNVSIYAGTFAAVRNCSCQSCLNAEIPPASCNSTRINNLKKLSGVTAFKPDESKMISQGDYHFLVVERRNGMDIALYHYVETLKGDKTVTILF